MNTRIKDARRRHAAFHEAGHVVARWALGLEVTEVCIREDGSGYTCGTEMSFSGHKWTEKFVLVSLAGPAAEARARKMRTFVIWLTSGRQDVDEAKDLIQRMGPLDGWLDEYTEQSRQLVNGHWQAIESVANALIEWSELSAEDIDHLLGEAGLQVAA